jgi:hypothetical protein
MKMKTMSSTLKESKMDIYDHFVKQELVPIVIAKKFGNDKILRLFDDRALWTLLMLRKRYEEGHKHPGLYINDYHFGGINQYRGWRPGNCPVGAEFSQHKFGRAFDCIFRNISAEEVREDIRKNPTEEAFKYITAVELDVSWFHFSTENHNKEKYGILWIKP